MEGGDAYGDPDRLSLPGVLGPGFTLPRAQPAPDVPERQRGVRAAAFGSGAGVLNAAALGRSDTVH